MRRGALTLLWVLTVAAAALAAASPTPPASPSPAASASPDASPSPDADASPDASPSPAVHEGHKPGASPAASPSAGASPATPDGSAEASPEASPSPEASASPDAEGSPSAKKEVDPFEDMDRRLQVYTPRKASVRNPFDPGKNPILRPKVEVALAPPGSEQQAKYFHITSVFFGANLRAVRVEGRRIAEGQWFSVSDGKVTSVGEDGDFQLEAVTPAFLTFRHKNGESVRRPTDLRRQETPPPAPSPSASPSPDSSPEPAASPSPAGSASPSTP